MNIKRLAFLAIFPFLLVSCKKTEDKVDAEFIELGTQEYLDQALACGMYFTYSGNKKAAELALMNAVREVSQNKNLNFLSIEDLEEITGKEVGRVIGLFDETEASKREASYYLISKNDCLAHATMGGLWGLLNQDAEGK
ncbi:hypothetical protein [Halomonas alkalisoli]|uniref:hypothetical protein n=1 Tax=Halomonas alkalisoli TaxID=2907158 RepID=UPI001F2A8094|nr:hypothetical protein [Halomonas alkalisoli]MCE9684007.1 hypothetical protein [Halomonas alkalisoli]